jgi:hypothetical protein
MTEFSDYRIMRQGWTIVVIYDTGDESRRIIAQGEGMRAGIANRAGKGKKRRKGPISYLYCG